MGETRETVRALAQTILDGVPEDFGEYDAVLLLAERGVRLATSVLLMLSDEAASLAGEDTPDVN
jgi:hypothetical protein